MFFKKEGSSNKSTRNFEKKTGELNEPVIKLPPLEEFDAWLADQDLESLIAWRAKLELTLDDKQAYLERKNDPANEILTYNREVYDRLNREIKDRLADREKTDL